jgi:hypothetical protein
VNALLGESISLVVGIVTGFVFERRATRGVKESNEDLQNQISALRTGVLGLGIGPPARSHTDGEDDLAALVTKRAMATQGPEGRVDRSALVAHFVERSYLAREVDAVISSICRAGLAEEEGRWLRMT